MRGTSDLDANGNIVFRAPTGVMLRADRHISQLESMVKNNGETIQNLSTQIQDLLDSNNILRDNAENIRQRSEKEISLLRSRDRRRGERSKVGSRGESDLAQAVLNFN